MVGFRPYTWNDCEQRKRKRCLKNPILSPCQKHDCLGKEVRYAFDMVLVKTLFWAHVALLHWQPMSYQHIINFLGISI